MRILLAAAALLVVSTACNRTPQSVHIDPSIETLVPRDTVLLVGARLEKLLKTPVYEKNFANRDIPQINQLAQIVGIDPRKDLWELLYVSNGKNGAVLARGKFADDMMEPQIERHGAQRFGYKGLTMFGDESNAVVLINSTTAALGSVPNVEALVDKRGTSQGPSQAMQTLVKQIPYRAQFWAAYGGGPIHLPFDENSNLGNLNRILHSIQTGTLWFDLTDGLTGLAQATCASDDAAQQLESALKAFIGLGRLSVPRNQPELAQVYDRLQVTQDGHQVHLHIDIPQSMVDQFLSVWLGRR